ncbi:MAG: sigma 54-interacting transcriptional regulator, partial [Candidatus Acidiferrales bacterium]
LEEGEIERVGGDRPIPVNVRVVVATHRNLEEQVRRNTFRQDLYHRIFVFPVVLPPLRGRLEDVPVLAEHFAQQVAEQNGWKATKFSPAAITELSRYSWPGNVRELRNVVERVLLLAAENEVDAATIRTALPRPESASGIGEPDAIYSGRTSGAASGAMAERVEAFERETILAELKRHHNHMTNTAKALGLERSHLYKKCQHLGIDLRSIRKEEDE